MSRQRGLNPLTDDACRHAGSVETATKAAKQFLEML